jgi:hypothetical protein
MDKWFCTQQKEFEYSLMVGQIDDVSAINMFARVVVACDLAIYHMPCG